MKYFLCTFHSREGDFYFFKTTHNKLVQVSKKNLPINFQKSKKVYLKIFSESENLLFGLGKISTGELNKYFQLQKTNKRDSLMSKDFYSKIPLSEKQYFQKLFPSISKLCISYIESPTYYRELYSSFFDISILDSLISKYFNITEKKYLIKFELIFNDDSFKKNIKKMVESNYSFKYCSPGQYFVLINSNKYAINSKKKRLMNDLKKQFPLINFL